MLGKTCKALPAILACIALAGCIKPAAPMAMAPAPPPPVGHAYQVMVQVPAPARHIRVTAAQHEELQQAFNVIALKSALMVGALSCAQQGQYDQFMTAFQPHILAEQHVMDQYFRRGSGYYGQTREDAFVTLLANNQSVGGIAQGRIFCLNNSAEFAAVLALKTPSDLDSFVTDLPPNAPIVVAAGASVTPLAPNDTAVHVAVIHSSRRVHLVQERHRRHYLVAQTHAAHATAPADATVAAVASAPAKPPSVAAAVPH